MVNTTRYFSISEVSEQELKFLDENYKLSLVHVGIPHPQKNFDNNVIEELQVRELGSVTTNDCLYFIKENFYEYWKPMTTERDFEKLKSQADGYFSLQLKGAAYFLNNKFVGLVLANIFEQHPAINKKAVHIGYFGYDRTLLDFNKARFVKFHAMKIVKDFCEANGGISAVANVDYFNKRCLAFVKNIGMSPIKFRTDEKL